MLDLLKKISILPAALLMLAACRKEEPGIIIPEPSGIQVFNLENRTVRSYLDRLELQPYTDGDYSYSWIDEYWDMTPPTARIIRRRQQWNGPPIRKALHSPLQYQNTPISRIPGPGR